jgi:hypothetical protein
MTADAQSIKAQGDLARHELLGKLKKAGKFTPLKETISNISCHIFVDQTDPDGGDKIIGIRRGVKRVAELGYDLPGSMEFYCSSVGGFQSIAYHRQFGGTNRTCVICLAKSATDLAGMVGRKGIADAVGQGGKSRYCEAVVVHEIAHNLHERQSPGYFWDEAKEMPNVEVARTKVSQYSAVNRLEFVAEVFTGRAYGITYSNDVNSLYAQYVRGAKIRVARYFLLAPIRGHGLFASCAAPLPPFRAEASRA